MEKLEYKIGRLNISLGNLLFTGTKPYEAGHKFVVESLKDTVLIYVTKATTHRSVADYFNLEELKVGGGSFYLNTERDLVLNDFSSEYNAIPKEAAQKFAELIVPQLEKLGVEVRGIAVDPKEIDAHWFWEEKGFKIKL